MAAVPDKAAGAFRTIGELSRETGLPQHILRYWETRFPQLRPLQRAGNRRYYRPDDVALVLRINSLLNHEGYTIRGVQKLLSDERKRGSAGKAAAQSAEPEEPVTAVPDLQAVRAIRDSLAAALRQDSSES